VGDYRYLYQGLTIASQIPLDRILVHVAPASTQRPDISVSIGAPPLDAVFTTIEDGLRMGPGIVEVTVEGVGPVTVLNGDEIRIHLLAGAEEILLQQYVLGTAFAITQMQRRRFCLHAGVAADNAAAFAFCGESGEGKSTLMMALAQRGWNVLTDDLSLLHPLDGHYVAAGEGHHIKLWRESAQALGISVNGYQRVSNNEDKYIVTGNHPARHSPPAPLKAVFFLESAAESAPFSLEPMPSLAGFAQLRKHTYRSMLIPVLGLEREHLAFSAALSGTARLFRFIRPRTLKRLPEMADFIARQLEQLA